MGGDRPTISSTQQTAVDRHHQRGDADQGRQEQAHRSENLEDAEGPDEAGLVSATQAPPLPSLTAASLSKETKVLLMPPIMAAKARSPAGDRKCEVHVRVDE